jgi:alcohol dehydrogenase class IV
MPAPFLDDLMTPPLPSDPLRYDLVLPSTVAFGAGRFAEVGAVAARFGREAWVVTGTRSLDACGGEAGLTRLLAAAGLRTERVAVCTGEPTVDDVVSGVRSLPRDGLDAAVVVAVGGGAAIDLAKAIAALATNVANPAGIDDSAVADHLEGVGRGLPIARQPLPVVAIPTTAGTGAEATRNAVISCPRRRFKRSMRSPLMVPRAAIVDPELTATCPREVTVASGLDAITQLVEAYVCRNRAAMPRALVIDALPRAVAALPRVLADPHDADARAAMSHAALVSGIALTNSGLGMAHGVAAALGIECGTPHGLACAVMLPVALAVNRPACRDDFARLERAIDPTGGDDAEAAADAFVVRIERLCESSGSPRRLADLGLDRGRLPWLAENSVGGSLRGNPVPLDPAALLPILERAW